MNKYELAQKIESIVKENMDLFIGCQCENVKVEPYNIRQSLLIFNKDDTQRLNFWLFYELYKYLFADEIYYEDGQFKVSVELPLD